MEERIPSHRPTRGRPRPNRIFSVFPLQKKGRHVHNTTINGVRRDLSRADT